jgi:hypothetical protein
MVLLLPTDIVRPVTIVRVLVCNICVLLVLTVLLDMEVAPPVLQATIAVPARPLLLRIRVRWVPTVPVVYNFPALLDMHARCSE